MSGVGDVYIYCGAHTADVEHYIQASKWHPVTSPASPFNTLEIVKTTARSVGDALRDLDARDLITGDFLLVHGDLVSNLPIDAALAAHRARRIADKNAIMTMILRSGGARIASHEVTRHHACFRRRPHQEPMPALRGDTPTASGQARQHRPRFDLYTY
jgi:NDP-sugar pyrophosphorylase family protein